MKKTALVLVGFLCLRLAGAEPAPAPASGGALASPQSVERLLEVMQVHKTVDAMMDQMDKFADQIAAGAARGKSLSDEDRAAVAAESHKIFQNIRQSFSWEKLEKMYVQVYSETFTENEIAGMTAFYSTPVGQSAIQKLPIVLQKTMVQMQPLMRNMIQSAQAQVKQYVEELKSKHAGKTG